MTTHSYQVFDIKSNDVIGPIFESFLEARAFGLEYYGGIDQLVWSVQGH